jgi:hypothetical protein
MIKINFKARDFMWYKIIFNCKSKDGAKTLIPSWDYRFDFCGKTLFYCDFAWGNTVKWFDVYTSKRDSRINLWWVQINGI